MEENCLVACSASYSATRSGLCPLKWPTDMPTEEQSDGAVPQLRFPLPDLCSCVKLAELTSTLDYID